MIIAKPEIVFLFYFLRCCYPLLIQSCLNGDSAIWKGGEKNMADTTNRGLGSDDMDQTKRDNLGDESSTSGGHTSNVQDQKGGQSSDQTEDETGFTTPDDDIDQGI